ncbi:hypothetical protein CXB41_06030 [Pseudomonas syringae pv. syringae]|nr:hypothetical protein CXB41_06030 [Pseudomonas syringae pv. syringae]
MFRISPLDALQRRFDLPELEIITVVKLPGISKPSLALGLIRQLPQFHRQFEGGQNVGIA